MPEYRFFRVAQSGHIHEPPIGVEAEGDGEAIKAAREKLWGINLKALDIKVRDIKLCDIEVWQGARLVAYLTPAQFAPASFEPVTDAHPDAGSAPEPPAASS